MITNMKPSGSHRHSSEVRVVVPEEKLSAFSWTARIPLPTTNNVGYAEFSFQDERVLNLFVVDLPRSLIQDIHLFLSSYLTYGLVSNTEPYLQSVSDTLKEHEIDGPEIRVFLAWTLIYAGLFSYSNAFSSFLRDNPEADVYALPISPLHLWCISEAIRAYLADVDPDKVFPEIHAACIRLLSAGEDETNLISRIALPYLNVVTFE